MPPWTQWLDRIAPISAKRAQVQPLKNIINKRLAMKR
jgi:hypothetical protein